MHDVINVNHTQNKQWLTAFTWPHDQSVWATTDSVPVSEFKQFLFHGFKTRLNGHNYTLYSILNIQFKGFISIYIEEICQGVKIVAHEVAMPKIECTEKEQVRILKVAV